MSPQASFLPYNGIDDSHGILVQSNYGEILQNPIAIFPEDQQIIKEIEASQNLRPGSKVLYKTDSLPTEFELIRIDFEPENYSDFNSLSSIRIKKEATGKTCFFKMDVEPNRYYYYTFRAYDEGGVSNPTEVFRVRIVSYQNGIFMEMETFEMREEKKEFSLSFENMIKISPATHQKTFNFEEVPAAIAPAEGSQDFNSLDQLRNDLGLVSRIDNFDFQKSAPETQHVILGPRSEEEKVWDKKFKIRVKSKLTGKAIDFNVVFEQLKWHRE